MSNRNNIYADLDEKFVKTVVIYGDSDSSYVFYDEAKKTKIPKDELFELFLKGATVFVLDQYCKIVMFKDVSTHAKIVVVGESSNISLYSSEMSPD